MRRCPRGKPPRPGSPLAPLAQRCSGAPPTGAESGQVRALRGVNTCFGTFSAWHLLISDRDDQATPFLRPTRAVVRDQYPSQMAFLAGFISEESNVQNQGWLI
ncbi:hypothetical protein AV530_010582 [Patagioenas fasciata monilis]|uniref:Uncharacterized protein n=1 Tax=Patagioenas fasciata monilis TaxID=372326 RepID=A0A1V4KFE7_PATFA|nr:hypothetical protein AV530_010582 [Patagioenas fasciata monilis]